MPRSVHCVTHLAKRLNLDQKVKLDDIHHEPQGHSAHDLRVDNELEETKTNSTDE